LFLAEWGPAGPPPKAPPEARLAAMAGATAESWSERAQRVLAESRHHSGGARRAVVELLASQPCALSALEIEDALRAGNRRVGRASIYRILDELERLDLVQKVQVGQAMTRYEPVRGDVGHHHHLVCDSCGAVMPFTDPELERAIQKTSRRVPIDVAVHEIVLHGACEECRG
jgi:Fur family transcriptional regulator, ferric uptake regulator